MDPILAAVVIVIALAMLALIVGLLAAVIVAIVFRQSDVANGLVKAIERIARETVKRFPK